MRNLKRALSLAMASVMLLGMMVVGTSAKGMNDFSDAAEVVNQDAVAVTSEIGIFDGYDDGEFKPENVVTRAEMAVIICKMLYGADVEVAQFAETKVFTDVPAWAEGYVNLCASLGIVAGVGDNKFDPNATVTTAQAAMMLTKALGYFQNARDFGDNWVLAATAKATQLGLYGDLKLSAAAGLTRENVAVLVFNALTKAVPVQYNELLGVYYNENQGIIYSLEFNYLETLGYKNFDLVYKSNTQSMYGRPATTWGFGSYKGDKGTTASGNKDADLTENGGLKASLVRMLDKDEIITVANEPTYVYTEGTASKDIYKDLGASVCKQNGDYTWTAYVNGAEQKTANQPAKNDSEDYAYTGEGAVTEIYIDDADQTVVVVEINYYLGQVAKVKSDDDGEYITVDALSKEAKLNDKKFYVEGYEEDDYVVFTIDQNEDGDYIVGEVMNPETMTGEVSRVENDKNNHNTYLRVEGTKYPYSGEDHIVYDLSDVNTRQHPELATDYVLYMDPNGYVLGFEKAEETVDQYLLVLETHQGLRDEATVLLATGEEVDVRIDDITKADGKTGSISDLKQWNEKEAGTICTYTVDSNGRYDLKIVSKSTVEVKDSKASAINAGRAYFDANGKTVIVDNKTTFVDYNGEKIYTGYKEVPSVDGATLAYVMNDAGKIAKIVFILQGDIYDSDSTYFFLKNTDHESLKYDGKYYREYTNAYVNGEKQTLYVRYDALTGNDADALSANVLYQVKKTVDEEYIINVVEADVKIDHEEIETVGTDAFWLDYQDLQIKDGQFDVNEDTDYVVVTYKDDGVKIDSIDTGRLSDMDDEDYDILVSVVKKDGQTAELVYIFRTPVGEKSSDTSVEVTVKGVKATEVSEGKFEVTAENVADVAKFVATPAKGAKITDLKVDGKAWNGGDSEDVFADAGERTFTFTVVAADGTKQNYEVKANIIAEIDYIESSAALAEALTDSSVEEIYLGAGTYSLAATSIQGDKTIIGVPGKTVIRTSNSGASEPDNWALKVENTCENLVIEGVTFKNVDAKIAIKQQSGSGYTFEITNCTFEGYNTAIQLFHADAGEITGCTFDSKAVDISLSDLSGVVVISGNTYSVDNTDENIGVLVSDKDNLDIRDTDADVVYWA